jgi:hypothetical protein
MEKAKIYQELKDLAEKLDITVSEENLRIAGIKVKSGLCKVKGRNVFIMDKHKSLHKKIKMLACQLAAMDHEEFFIIPAVREVLSKHRIVDGAD